MANACCPPNAAPAYFPQSQESMTNQLNAQYRVCPLPQQQNFQGNMPQMPQNSQPGMKPPGMETWPQMMPQNFCMPFPNQQYEQPVQPVVPQPQQALKCPPQNQDVKPTTNQVYDSRYIVGGRLLCDCSCNKRNGIQDDCLKCKDVPAVVKPDYRMQPQMQQQMQSNPQMVPQMAPQMAQMQQMPPMMNQNAMSNMMQNPNMMQTPNQPVMQPNMMQMQQFPQMQPPVDMNQSMAQPVYSPCPPMPMNGQNMQQ